MLYSSFNHENATISSTFKDSWWSEDVTRTQLIDDILYETKTLTRKERRELRRAPRFTSKLRRSLR